MGIKISYPLVNKPVVYEDDSEEDESSDLDVAQQIHEINVKYCEEMIQMRERSKAARKLFEEFESQQEVKYAEVLERFPYWTEEDINKLKLQFMVTDSNSTHLVSFSEFVSSLNDMEDKSSMKERERYFNTVDKDKSGMIDFETFLQLMYNMKQDGWNIEMTYSQLVSKLQSARTSGSEKAGVINKMDTFQQMCYKVF